MAELKRILPSAAPVALEKALRYRLLNEPMQAESICRDVLEVDPSNKEALVTKCPRGEGNLRLFLKVADPYDIVLHRSHPCQKFQRLRQN